MSRLKVRKQIRAIKDEKFDVRGDFDCVDCGCPRRKHFYNMPNTTHLKEPRTRNTWGYLQDCPCIRSNDEVVARAREVFEEDKARRLKAIIDPMKYTQPTESEPST